MEALPHSSLLAQSHLWASVHLVQWLAAWLPWKRSVGPQQSNESSSQATTFVPRVKLVIKSSTRKPMRPSLVVRRWLRARSLLTPALALWVCRNHCPAWSCALRQAKAWKLQSSPVCNRLEWAWPPRWPQTIFCFIVYESKKGLAVLHQGRSILSNILYHTASTRCSWGVTQEGDGDRDPHPLLLRAAAGI